MKKVVFAKDVLYRVLAAVVQNDVLHVAWQDNNLVLALTTSYSVHEVDDTVSKKRTRPSKTSTNARIVLPAFQENGQPVSEKEFAVPKSFYYYMGEVDQFNALVAAYTSQRACNWNWMRLFNWHLDGSLSNAFKLCEPKECSARSIRSFSSRWWWNCLKKAEKVANLSHLPPQLLLYQNHCKASMIGKI